MAHGHTCFEARGIIVPLPGIEPTSPVLQDRFLTTGSSGKSKKTFLILQYSTSHITTAAFTLASGHPGVEIKILYYCTLYSTVKYPKAQPRVEDACTWQRTPDT